MTNTKINPASLRIPTNAYSQGVLVPCGKTNLLFVTGQLPQDIDGNIIHIDDPDAQTRLVLMMWLKYKFMSKILAMLKLFRP